MSPLCRVTPQNLAAGRTRHTLHQLGMPELTQSGLSESWLFRRAGHMHWDLTAEALATPTHEIVDMDGRRLYAAFLSVSVEGRSLGDVGENDLLRATHRLRAFAPPYAVSEMTVYDLHAPNADPLATVTLLSVFVRRDSEGENRKVTKSIPLQGDGDRFGARIIQELRRDHRSGRQVSFADGDRFDYPVCPDLDMNGAGFLYFAAMLDIAKRAEARSLDGKPSIPTLGPFRRSMTYYGNENADATLSVAIRDPGAASGEAHALEASIAANGGARLLARSFVGAL